MNHIISNSEQETAALAATLASDVQVGDVLCLYGDLGAGKSVFARGLIRALTGDTSLQVPSPTFTLVEVYETNTGPLWHFDLYRLTRADEVYELGWEEALADGICVIEWPVRLGALMPARRTDIHMTTVPGEEQARRIEIKTVQPGGAAP